MLFVCSASMLCFACLKGLRVEGLHPKGIELTLQCTKGPHVYWIKVQFFKFMYENYRFEHEKSILLSGLNRNHACLPREAEKETESVCVQSICSAPCIICPLSWEQLRTVTCWQRSLLAATGVSRSDGSTHRAHKQACMVHEQFMWAKGRRPLLFNKHAWCLHIVQQRSGILLHVEHQTVLSRPVVPECPLTSSRRIISLF